MQRRETPLLLALLVSGTLAASAAAQQRAWPSAGAGLVDPCLCQQPPVYWGTAAFEVLILHRSELKPLELVTVDGTPALNATDLDFSPTAAFRVELAVPTAAGRQLEFSYLGSRFETMPRFSGTTVEDRFFDVVGTQTDLDFFYESKLHSIELNLRGRSGGWLTPLVGIRYAELNEDTVQLDTVNDLAFFGELDNELIGLQLGAEACLWSRGGLRVESTVKAGVYASEHQVSGRTATQSLSRMFHRETFLGEAALQAVYRLGPRLAVRAGYQLVVFSDVGLLPNQYDDFQLATGAGTVDLEALVLQGGSVGFELTW